MEQLLHYVWKHKLFPLKQLVTVDGHCIEVIDTGLHNHDAGPDFFNAKVKIDGTLWVGNVEIHDRASDWFAHRHEQDTRYDNVILHVCGAIDAEATDSQGRRIKQLQLDVPAHIAEHYEELIHSDHYPPCYRIIPSLPSLMIHSWMSSLQTERLEQKTVAINERVARYGGDWQAAHFATMARNYGFGINGEAFEQWACNIPLGSVAHHRDDLFQIEAIFMGQAGLLEPESIPEAYRDKALADAYYQRMASEYRYLAHKFAMQPMDFHWWKFLRLRPQNFPHIRLSQLAQLYYNRTAGLSELIECSSLSELRNHLKTQATPYWQTHFAFGAESPRSEKRLSMASLDLMILNTVVPMLFAYGRHTCNEGLCEHAFELLEQLKAEDNHIVRMWHECGMKVENAGDTQALIQLKNEYCDHKDCLRCRIGYEYLKRGNDRTTSIISNNKQNR
uniref:DUF2851 family protein n=1 Tax=Prevotella sp. GTC17253 TaxID=3236793 RepID=A0AB33J097_9BACT